MRSIRNLPSALLVLLLLATSTASAQTRTLYTGDANTGYSLVRIQGGAVVGSSTGDRSCMYGMAVAADVRFAGCSNGGAGQEFTLGGTRVGYLPATANVWENFLDGTTDGIHNYATANYGQHSDYVYSANLDWSNMQPLFNTGRDVMGISYDRGRNSLWIGEFDGGNSSVFEYALDGTLRSSFHPTLGFGTNGISALAFDNVDQTIWLTNYTQRGTLFQFDRNGTQLQSFDVAGSHGYIIGAEFADDTSATPEPASLVLLATGLVGLAGFGRRFTRK